MTNTIALFQISTEESLRFQLKFIGLDLSGRVLKVDVKERDTDIVKTTLQIGTGLTLNGADDLTAHYARGQMATWAKGEYQADIVDHTNDDPLRIVAVRFVYDRPGKLIYGVRGNQATVLWANNQAVVTAIGGVGPPGPANSLAIGTVATGAAGSGASASVTGAAPNQTLNLTIPRGDTGNTGAAATIAAGTTTTGAAGSNASVTNSGTSGAAVFNFTIPRGNTGVAGPANTLTIGTVSTVAPGGSATASVTGSAPNQTLNIGIPRGDQGPSGSVTDGDKGDIGVTGSGTVWTIDSNAVDNAKLRDSAALSVIGRSANSRGDPADIAADTDGHVLRRSGATIGFGRTATTGIEDAAVTNAKLANVATATFKGRNTVGTGVPEDLTAAQAAALLPAVIGDSGAGGTKGLVPAPAAGDAAAGKVLGAGGAWISAAGRTIGETIRGSFTSLPALCLWKNGQNVSRSTYALLFNAITIAGTVSTTNTQTSATLTLADAEAVAQVQVGMPIEATGIQAGTTITARGTATATTLVVTLSLAANATAGANAVRIFPNGNGNGSTTFGVGDDRDRASVGRGNMGGTAADRLTQASAGFNSSRLGATGGDQRMQGHNHGTGIPTANHVQAGGSGVWVAQTDGATYSSATAVAGAGVSQNVQPSTVDNAVIFAGV